MSRAYGRILQSGTPKCVNKDRPAPELERRKLLQDAISHKIPDTCINRCTPAGS